LLSTSDLAEISKRRAALINSLEALARGENEPAEKALEESRAFRAKLRRAN
jgi:hypothetical protein